MSEMPKMPEPNGYIVGLQWIRHKKTADSLSDDPLEVYTADQMRAFANEATRQAMERAIRACLDLQAPDFSGLHPAQAQGETHRFDMTTVACANAIRALADVAGEKGVGK